MILTPVSPALATTKQESTFSSILLRILGTSTFLRRPARDLKTRVLSSSPNSLRPCNTSGGRPWKRDCSRFQVRPVEYACVLCNPASSANPTVETKNIATEVGNPVPSRVYASGFWAINFAQASISLRSCCRTCSGGSRGAWIVESVGWTGALGMAFPRSTTTRLRLPMARVVHSSARTEGVGCKWC